MRPNCKFSPVYGESYLVAIAEEKDYLFAASDFEMIPTTWRYGSSVILAPHRVRLAEVWHGLC